MSIGRRSWLITLFALLAFSTASAQHSEHVWKGQNLSDLKFAAVPGLPECAPGAVLSGDPAKGPSILLGKLSSGCTIPWHWHTPNEHLMLVRGAARLEMRDGKTFTLQAGGFALMPTRHIHQFRCEKDCLLYVYSDGAFDIHYVNSQGNEISTDEALSGASMRKKQ
jgi:quercetin dioxygenase-like cupin family protein